MAGIGTAIPSARSAIAATTFRRLCSPISGEKYLPAKEPPINNSNGCHPPLGAIGAAIQVGVTPSGNSSLLRP